MTTKKCPSRVVIWFPPTASQNVAVPEPSRDQLRALAAEITSRPEYDLVPRPVDTQWMSDLLFTVLEWVVLPFQWVYHLTAGLPEFLRVIVVLVLAVALVALVGHIVYSLAGAMRGGDDGTLSPDKGRRGIEPSEWERRASAAAGAGEFITAVRHLFRATLGRLEQAEKKPFRPGTTNRDLLRRYRTRSEIAEGLRMFVDTIDRKWYGDEACTENDYAVCLTAYGGVRRAAAPAGGPHAIDT